MRISLRDGDCHITRGSLVIDVAGECPMRRAVRDIGDAGTETEQARESLAFHPCRRAASPMRVAVVDSTEAVDVDMRISLRDGDGHVARGSLVIGVARERP